MPPKKRKTAIAGCAAMFLALGLVAVLIRHQHMVHLDRVQGAWEGTLRFHVGQLMRRQRMVMRVFKENGSYRAVFDQIDMGKKNIPATRFAVGGSSVVFESSSNFVYRASLNDEATELTGRWSWPGAKRSQPLTLTRTQTPDVVPEPLAIADYTRRPGSDLQGLWKGTLDFGSVSLRLHLKVAESVDGKFRCELNSIDQPPIIPLPATTVEYHKPRVTLSFQGIGAEFDGQLDDGDTTISGKWTQAKVSSLTLTRIDPKTE